MKSTTPSMQVYKYYHILFVCLCIGSISTLPTKWHIDDREIDQEIYSNPTIFEHTMCSAVCIYCHKIKTIAHAHLQIYKHTHYVVRRGYCMRLAVQTTDGWIKCLSFVLISFYFYDLAHLFVRVFACACDRVDVLADFWAVKFSNNLFVEYNLNIIKGWKHNTCPYWKGFFLYTCYLNTKHINISFIGHIFELNSRLSISM